MAWWHVTAALLNLSTGQIVPDTLYRYQTFADDLAGCYRITADMQSGNAKEPGTALVIRCDSDAP